MSIYKRIYAKDITYTNNEVYVTRNLTSASDGITSIQYTSGSGNISGSYWDSLHFNFYLSGSNTISKSEGYKSLPKFEFTSIKENTPSNHPQHKNKFYSTGTVISIPQQYFGDRIRKTSFKLVDNSHGKDIKICDDGFGNLYSTNAEHSQSSTIAGKYNQTITASLSSSENYIGNIFYSFGIVTLTETGSWSGSVNYTNIATSTSSYTINFDSTDVINTVHYSLPVKASEFNGTSNLTVFQHVSNSLYPSNHSSSMKEMLTNLTSSGWSPYITSIGFYDDTDNLVMIARYPQPIKKLKNTDMTFEVNVDL